jgi:hypothetical protein
MNTIDIQSISVWTPNGAKTAVKFSVDSVNYQNGPAFAICRLIDSNGAGIAEQTIAASPEQTALWNGDDDLPFYRVIAQNANLTPL